MNIKRFFLAAIAVYLFLLLYNWLFTDLILTGIYTQIANILHLDLAKQTDTFRRIMPHLTHVVFALALVCLYAKGFDRKTIGSGLLYGLLVAFIVACVHAPHKIH